MGILGQYESQQVEIEGFRRMLLSCAGLRRKKGEDVFRSPEMKHGDDGDDKLLVCVTSGVSFLGLAIVNRLLIRGYSVRLIVTNEEDMEKLREMEVRGEMSAVMANFSDVESLSQAFGGCHGVFHTAALVDPAGLSGYSKSMVDIEVKACENVMEACAKTSSVRKCVLTSSLLACIWRDNSSTELSSSIHHDCWSDESVCSEKKLWYALGKLRAEKAAWRIAEKRDVKLVTICPALITGPQFCHRNPTASVAYLKGAQEMFADGLLATADVNRLAEAHICVYEAMNKTAFGRYIYFDRLINSGEEAEKLGGELGMQLNVVASRNVHANSSYRFELSNFKICRLLSKTQCSNEC